MRLYGGFSFRRALKSYGWAVCAAAIVAALVWSAYAPNPIEEAGDAVSDVIASAENLRCPSGWKQTDDRAPDAENRLKTRTCSSADGRYIITAREENPPTGLDTTEKRFMTAAEIDAVLR